MYTDRMTTRQRLFIALVSIFLLLSGCCKKAPVPTAAPGQPATAAEGAVEVPTGTFSVDSVHSSVLFRVRHGAGFFWGAFKTISGKLTLDKDVSKSTVEITINAKSIDTRNAGRDKHLRGPDFFNVKQFPKITFSSTSVKAAGKGVLEVTGDLTLHGVKKPVTLKIVTTGTGKTRKGAVTYGGEAVFSFKRSEYGMKFMVGKGLGDEIRITLSLEIIQQ